MKIKEFRDELKKADRTQVEAIASELYKSLPKAKKEDADISIQTILAGVDLKKTKKQDEIVNFNELKNQIQVFLEDANQSYYFIPNRIIPKSNRSKWRFKVKQFLKDLSKVQADTPEYLEAKILLKDVYKLLCKACNVYLFSTNNPFHAVGIAQCDMFYDVSSAMLHLTPTNETMREILVLATSSGLDYSTLHAELEFIVLNELKTKELEILALEEAKSLVQEQQMRLKQIKKSSSSKYYIEHSVEELCKLVLLIHMKMDDGEEGVRYFFKNYKGYEKEIELYSALYTIDLMEDDELWVWTYTYGIKNKIKPRDELKEQYKKKLLALKENK